MYVHQREDIAADVGADTPVFFDDGLFNGKTHC